VAAARAAPAFKPALVAPDLTLGQVGRFESKRLEHPEFEIDVRHLRLYRHGPARPTSWATSARPPRTRSTPPTASTCPGDLVGKKGVEQSYDRHLRGDDGERVVVVDSRARVLEEYRRDRAEAGGPSPCRSTSGCSRRRRA
jgi:cell division protein FtsI/penicillin-binding protein 2